VIGPEDYKVFPEYWKNPATRSWNLERGDRKS
jgi:hypothetical protein